MPVDDIKIAAGLSNETSDHQLFLPSLAAVGRLGLRRCLIMARTKLAIEPLLHWFESSAASVNSISSTSQLLDEAELNSAKQIRHKLKTITRLNAAVSSPSYMLLAVHVLPRFALQTTGTGCRVRFHGLILCLENSPEKHQTCRDSPPIRRLCCTISTKNHGCDRHCLTQRLCRPSAAPACGIIRVERFSFREQAKISVLLARCPPSPSVLGVYSTN